tara:strand:- start:1630 stop:1743 length:114 start_codon:yes stop_codon:yes gene_type:complete
MILQLETKFITLLWIKNKEEFTGLLLMEFHPIKTNFF